MFENTVAFAQASETVDVARESVLRQNVH